MEPNPLAVHRDACAPAGLYAASRLAGVKQIMSTSRHACVLGPVQITTGRVLHQDDGAFDSRIPALT